MKLSIGERLRTLFQNPYEAVRAMGIAEGQKVADIGAGLGYFTFPAAAAVGPAGLVYAVEPDAARSNRLQERVASKGLRNVHVLATGAEHLGDISSGSIDLAFSAFSLHHFSDRQTALAEIRRVIREGGTFFVWDRVPGTIVRHGTRPQELSEVSAYFSRFELLSTDRTAKARFTK